MPLIPMGNAPVFDEGGDVDVNDGNHQAAILEGGERVLTPEENVQYKAEHAAPLIAEEPARRMPVASNTEKPVAPEPVVTEEAPQNKPGYMPRISAPVNQHANDVVEAPLIPEEKTAPTKGGVLADAYLKHIGAPETAQMPKYQGPGKSVAQGQLIPEKQLPQDELKYQLADLQKQHSAALAERTPEGQEKADRIALQIQDVQKSNPWGSAANHPGALGRIGHIAEMVASRAPVSAGIMATIPGSEVYRGTQHAATEAALDKDTQLNTQRQAEEGKETPRDTYKEATQGGLVDPKHPELGPQQAYVSEKDPTKIIYSGPMPAKAGAEKNAPASAEVIEAHKRQVATLGLTGEAAKVYGQVPAGLSEPQLEKRYADAKGLADLNDKQAQTKIANQARADAAAEHKTEHEETRDSKLVNYRDKNSDLVSGTRAEAKAAGVDTKDIHGETSAPLQEKARQAYTQYGRILDNTQQAEDTMGAWNNETDRKAAMEVSKQYWDHMSASVVIAGAGVNPEYQQQFINSDAYKRMSPQGQEHMQNMFQLWSDALNIVKQETGGVPRGQMFLQKEDAILPHPDKTPAMNEKALKNLAKRIRTDASEFARPSDMKPLVGGVIPRGAVPTMHNGQEVGYATPEQVRKGTYTPW
jgi:hypothetical protein